MFRSFRSLIGFGSKKNSSARKGSKFGKNFRAAFEKLEDRSVPANFTAGNLAILQAMASGSTNSDGRIVEINTTLAGQTPTQVFSIPNSGVDAYRMSGSATSTGYASLTSDRSKFTFTGANSDVTVGNVNVVNPRGAYTISNSGTITKETTYTASFTTNAQTRSATTIDGSSWFIVDQTGLYTNGSTAPSPAGNFRAAKTFGGTVYLGQQSSAATNIQVSTISAPSGGTVSGLPGLANNSTFQDFYLVSSGTNGSTYDVLYITSNTGATAGTIAKFSLVSGSWTSNGLYTTNFGGFAIAAADIDATNALEGSYLYVTSGNGATSANSVFKLTDTAGYNSTISITSGNNVTLFTAANGTTLKGLDFAPTASTNSAPTVAAPGTATASTAIGGTVTAFQSSNAFVVTDPDSSNTQTVTVTATAGSVSINTAGVSGVTGNGTGTLTFQGTLANVNAALTTLSFVAPSTVGGGSATISVSSNDGTVGSNTATATVTLTRATPTLTVTRGDTTYDGNPVAASYTLTGISGPAATLDSQTPTLTYYVGIGTAGTNLGSTAPTNAGTYTVAADFAQTANYEAVTSLPVTFVISQKVLTVTGITAESKTYDATTAATLSGTAELDGVVAGDLANVTLGGTPSASFADKIVESGKTVMVTGYSITGSASGNYTLTQPTLLTADITPLAIIGSITADDKEEDGTTTATIATRTLSGIISGDDVTYVGGTANFSQSTPGTGLTVTATGLSLAGLDAGNYTVNTTATTTANITPATGLPQSISFNPLDDKTYGDASFILSATAISGLTVTFIVASGPATIDGSTLTITGAGTVVVEAQQAGDGTYAPATPVQQSFDVFQKSLTATVTGINKIYDGTVVASVTYDALTELVGDDVVTAGGGTATFDTKNVGNGKTVTVTGIALGGADAANYVLSTSTATTTADITAKALTASATASNKVYDTTTDATVTVSLTGVIGSEDVTAGYTSASFSDKNVGLGKTVTMNGIALLGADAGNYTVNASAATTADISAATLVATATGVEKVYDGTTAATVTISLAGVIGSDDVSGTGDGAFANKNVGTNKPVSVTGIALSGADAPNYTVNTTASTTANITAKALTAAVTISNKNFDGTNAALIATRALSGVVGADAVTISGGTATFDDVSGAIGLNKPVSVSGLTLGGADAGNYSFGGSATATGSIGVAIALGDIALTGYQSATPDKISFVLLTDIVAGSALTITDNAWTGSALTTNEGVSTISFTTAFSAGTQFNFDASRAAGSKWAVGTETSNLFDVTTSNFALNGSGDNLFAYTSFAPPTTAGEASWVAAFASNPFLTSGSQTTSLTYLPSVFTVGDTAFSLGIANNAPNENGAYTGLSITDTASAIRTAVNTLSNWTTFTANAGQPVPPNATFTVTASSPSTITVTSGDVVYSGTAYVPTVTTTGSTGAVTYSFYLGANTDNPIGSAPVNAGTYSVIAHLASDGTFDAADSPLKTFTITQATATVTIVDYTGVYDGLSHAASVLITGVNGETASNSITGTNVAESGSVTATLANPGNYINPSGTATLTITQATATVTVIDYTGVYDGLSHTATVLITGVGGSGDILAQNSVSLTNVGTDSATTSISGLQNYLDASGTTTITITPATATVTVIDYTGVYDGLEHTATVLITGVGGSGDILAQNSVSLTNVGTDSATTSISGLQNYLDASGTTTVTITPATATVTVIDYTGVYDGLSHTATVLITGVGGSGDILAQNSVSLTNVGTDSATTSISGLQNYLDASGTTTITITPATATVTVIDYTGVYDGLSHTATVLITGVGGSSDILAQNSVSRTNAGTDSATTSISGLQNYLDASGTTTITITPATATVTVIDYTGVYDGLSHTATVLITGVGGSSDILAQNSVSRTNAGTDSTTANISGLQNYLNASGTATITIAQATATVTVTNYTGVYDGLTHTASVTVTGVNGETASNSRTGTNVADSSSVTATLSNPSNYINPTGTATLTITPAIATVTATNYTGIYDGLSHTASVLITGVNGETAANSRTGTNVADSGSVTATLANPGNYINPSGTATLTITPATATVTVADYTGVYDGLAHTASVTITGVGNTQLAYQELTGANVSDSGTVTASIAAGNYFAASGTATLTITPATATVTVADFTGVYDGLAHTASVTITGLGNTQLAYQELTGANVSDSGTVTASIAAGNYFPASGTATLTITPATATVTVTNYNNVYDGLAHTASVTITGLGNTQLAYQELTGANVSDSGTVTASIATGNYFAATGTATLTITPATATVTVADYTGVYDGLAHTASVTITGVGNTQLAYQELTGANVSDSGTVTASIAAGNYFAASGTATLTITPKALTGSITAADKVEDGTTTATITSRTLSGVISGDDVTYVGGTANFSQSTPGTGLTVTATGLSLAGGDAGNYTVNSTATTTANITPATGQPQTITFNPLANKTYGDASFVLTATATSGLAVTFIVASGPATIAGSTLTITGAGTVVVEAQQAGDATYAPATPVQQSFIVSQKSLTATVTGINKIYDGTTAANVTYDALTGLVGGDVVTAGGGTATFDTKNVGIGKTVTVTGITLGGADAANYVLASSTATTTADITPKALTLTAVDPTKVYDGTTNDVTVTINASGFVLGESATASATGSYSDKNVGSQSVTLSTPVLVGSGGFVESNYTFAAPTTATLTITPATATTTIVNYNDVYDGLAHTATVTVTGVNGESASNFITGTNVADSGSVTATLANPGNYTNPSGTATLTITPATATVTITNYNNVYDGLAHTASVAITGIGNAQLAYQELTGANVADSGTVTASIAAGNYFAASGTATLTITPATATVTVADYTGVYDGLAHTASVTITGVGNTQLAYQELTGANVADSGTVTASIAAGNYFAATGTATLTITPKALTGSITAADKVEDGTTTATITSRTLSGVISGDDVSYVGGTANFSQSTPGTGLTVTATGLSLAGGDAGNYTVNSTATTTANITPASGLPQTITFNPLDDKTYGEASFTLSATASSALAVTFIVASGPATIAGSTLTITGAGTVVVEAQQAGDGTYAPATPVQQSFIVSQKSLTATVTGINKIYDGTTAANVTYDALTGLVGGDVVTAGGGTATFDTKNVGIGKTVTVTGITLGGADAANYVLTSSTATTTADITPKALTLTAVDPTKVYDGTTNDVTVTINASGFVLGESATASATGSYSDKNVGSQSVTLSTPVLVGSGGFVESNYTFAAPTTATLTITPATATTTIVNYNDVYDGLAHTATVTITGVNGESASNSITGTNVADSGSVTATLANPGNYTNPSGTATLTITPKALTGSITADDKFFDGTTDATITNRTLSGVIDGDDVTYIGGIATFDDASVGNNKTVTATGLSLSGTDAGNYTVNGSATTTASILANVPTIISIVPFSGPTTGGTTVVITGTGFDYGIDDTTVMFGANAATIVSIDPSGTQLTATTPAGSAGLVEVVVTTPAGSSSTAGVGNDFTYVSTPAPVFNSMVLNGGAMYTIDSYGFSPTGLVGSNSIIAQLYVEFNVGVTLDAGAFTIDAGPVNVIIPGGISPVPVGTDVVTVIAEPQGAPEANGGYKGYRLRFSGSATYLNTFDNSATGTGGIGNISTTLKDGFYKLNIIGAHVHEGATTAGTPMAGNIEQGFWTLYGSVDPSDRDVAGQDHAGVPGDGSSNVSTNASLIGFAATNGSGRSVTPPPVYNAVYDWNLDGDIGDDLIEFAKRFGAEWQF